MEFEVQNIVGAKGFCKFGIEKDGNIGRLRV